MRRTFVLLKASKLKMLTYGSLLALYEENEKYLNISLSTLQHHDFDSEDYVSKDKRYKINGGFAKTTTEVRNELKSSLINILL